MTSHENYEFLAEHNAKFIEVTKFSLLQVIFPQWDELGLLGKIFRQVVRTKENPAGQLYEEATFRTVLRILNGKVFMTNAMQDSYAWTQETFLKKARNAVPCGTHTGHGVLGMTRLLATITDTNERLEVAEMFASMNRDLILCEVPEEKRTVCEVTDELYAAGLTSCVDEWQNQKDENGNLIETKLNIGDFLYINQDAQTVYCIRRDEFFATHTY